MRRRAAVVAAFMRRDLRTALSYRLPYTLDLFAVLVNVVLFFFVGRLVDGGALTTSDDLRDGYFPFVLVGLSLFGVASAGLTRFASAVRDEQMAGTLEVLLAQPVPATLMILGSVAYELCRAVATAIVTLLMGVLVFGVRFDVDAVVLVVAVAGFLAATLLFVAIGVMVGAFTLLYKQGQAVVSVAVVSISLLSGVYYPLEVMPHLLQQVAELLPTTWGLDLLRECLILGEVSEVRLVGLLGAAAVALPAALWLLGRALDRARALGSLGQY